MMLPTLKASCRPPSLGSHMQHSESCRPVLSKTFVSSSQFPEHNIHPSVAALDLLLRNPIKFVLATERTAETEDMAPILRPRTGTGPREPVGQKQRRNRTHHISKDWQRQAVLRTRSRGFFNPSVLCYRNSLLQALLHVPKFVNWLENHHRECGTQGCVVCSLKRLCERYWNGTEDLLAIDDRLRRLQNDLRGAEEFSGWNWNRQQDAMEFYVQLVLAMPALHIPSTAPNITIDDLVNFTTVTDRKCPTCGHKSPNSQAENQLIIPLRGRVQLTNILRHEVFARLPMDGYRCSTPSCGRVAESRKPVERLRLATTPEILVVQLRRFCHNLQGHIVKNTQVVKFGPILDLTTYTVNHMDTRYQLVSIVQHRGTLSGGHYTAVALSPDDQWHEIDDMDVKDVEEKAVFGTTKQKAASNAFDNFTPYVLVYRKMSVGRVAKRR